MVHYLDRENQAHSGVVYVDISLQEKVYVKLSEGNPYSADFPTDTTYYGLPIYDLRGISRAEAEEKIDHVVWDNKGEPTHVYTATAASNFAATNMVWAYKFNIVGTEGPMAAQTTMYIQNSKGEHIDSIKLIGSEVWNPAITDDGRFIAYSYGRAYPEEGGGDSYRTSSNL